MLRRTLTSRKDSPERSPPSGFSNYLEGGAGDLKPHADVLLVRRPAHLEHVYTLSLDRLEPGHEQALKLFRNLEGQFQRAGAAVAEQVYSLRCMAVELPDCVPKWRFIVPIARVHLVYDEALIPQNAYIRTAMSEAAQRVGIELHFHHAP